MTFPLIAAVLPQKSIGILELILTTTGLFGMFIQCGLNNSVQRFYWDDKINPKEKPILVSSAFSIQFFIGVLVLIISLCTLLLLSNFIQFNKFYFLGYHWVQQLF